MSLKIIVAICSFFFMITQIESSKRQKNHSCLNQSDETSGKGQYQQGGDGASVSKRDNKCKSWHLDLSNVETASSSNNFELDPDLMNLLLVPSPKNLQLGINTAEQLSNSIESIPLVPEYSEQEHDQYHRDLVDSFLQDPDEGEQQNADVGAQIIPAPNALSKQPSRPHNFIQFERSSMDERSTYCQNHWDNFRSARRAMTKCDTCNLILCAQCYAFGHGLDEPPLKPTSCPAQKCSYCNENIGKETRNLVDHSRDCQLIPRRVVDDKVLIYSCWKDTCNYMTYYKNHMQDHARSHTGEKPFICDDCGKEFTKNSNLSKHLRTVHNKNPIKKKRL